LDEVAALIDQMRALEPHVTVAGPAPEAAIRQLEVVFVYRLLFKAFRGLCQPFLVRTGEFNGRNRLA
jgi:hypothetical protein